MVTDKMVIPTVPPPLPIPPLSRHPYLGIERWSLVRSDASEFLQ